MFIIYTENIPLSYLELFPTGFILSSFPLSLQTLFSLYCRLIISCWKYHFWIAVVGKMFHKSVNWLRSRWWAEHCWWKGSLIKKISSKRLHLLASLTSTCFLCITGSIQTNDLVCGAVFVVMEMVRTEQSRHVCRCVSPQSIQNKMKHLCASAERSRPVWNRGRTMSGWTGAWKEMSLGACEHGRASPILAKIHIEEHHLQPALPFTLEPIMFL